MAWGSSQVVQLQAPCDTEYVCFIDRRIIDGLTTDEEYLEYIEPQSAKNIIQASVKTNTDTQSGDQTNVFTISPQGQVGPMEAFSSSAAAIRVSDGGQPVATCIQTQQETVRMRMSGTGRAVEIAKVN
jgi:hypothetical protein